MSIDQRVAVDDRQMDAEGIAIRACYDPSLFTKRRRAVHDGEVYAEEDLHRWQAHAVIVALEMAGYELPTPDGAHVTTHRPHAVPLDTEPAPGESRKEWLARLLREGCPSQRWNELADASASERQDRS
jgi:hypothetical protein